MQVVGLAELLIQQAIVFRRQRFGQVEIRGRKILAHRQSFELLIEDAIERSLAFHDCWGGWRRVRFSRARRNSFQTSVETVVRRAWWCGYEMEYSRNLLFRSG